MLRSFWRARWKQVTLIVALLFGVVNWDSILDLILLGYWPQSHIEQLNHSVAVNSWGPEGLHLANGSIVQLPGFTRLPTKSEALSRIAREGVELSPDGRVTGLIRIWHTCGNDALRNDVRRVDVAHVLEFMREGEFKRPIHKYDFQPFKPGGVFRRGWADGEYGLYKHFAKGEISNYLRWLDESAKKK